MDYNRMLIRQLISVLAHRDEGGFTRYLRQRNLFNFDLFCGGGPGHCPFLIMSNELIYTTAAVFDEALSDGVVMLSPDEPTL